MTRKRFIKLLMSQGVQRNDAEKYARERVKTIKNYEFLYFCFLGELMELFLEKWAERLESSKRDCFPDKVTYGLPEILRKEIQLNEKSYIKNDFEQESEELKFKEKLYRLYGEGEQNERF